VTGGEPIAVLLEAISGVTAINPLVAFYDIHGGKIWRYGALHTFSSMCYDSGRYNLIYYWLVLQVYINLIKFFKTVMA
jgi:hypothetical protein